VKSHARVPTKYGVGCRGGTMALTHHSTGKR
jgi:hypothetical protein